MNTKELANKYAELLAAKEKATMPLIIKAMSGNIIN